MSNAVCRVPLAPEMNPFDAKIRGNQELMTWPQAQDGCVVADALDYTSVASGRSHPAYAFYQFSFWGGHDVTNIVSKSLSRYGFSGSRHKIRQPDWESQFDCR
jgi:hypothetical protein